MTEEVDNTHTLQDFISKWNDSEDLQFLNFVMEEREEQSIGNDSAEKETDGENVLTDLSESNGEEEVLVMVVNDGEEEEVGERVEGGGDRKGDVTESVISDEDPSVDQNRKIPEVEDGNLDDVSRKDAINCDKYESKQSEVAKETEALHLNQANSGDKNKIIRRYQKYLFREFIIFNNRKPALRTKTVQLPECQISCLPSS